MKPMFIVNGSTPGAEARSGEEEPIFQSKVSVKQPTPSIEVWARLYLN